MTIEKELNLILNKAGVSAKLKKIWIEGFILLPAQAKADFMISLRESKPSQIKKTASLMGKKIEAFKAGDLKKTKKILKDELDYIKHE